VSALFHFPYRVRAATADEARELAKDQARAEGWQVKTLVRVVQSPNGDWVVTLAVRAAEKVAP
jgi:hypothetical protein